MAFTQLKTDYQNDQLNTSVNNNVKYNLQDNGDGTVSLEDVTSYTTLGDSFDASVLNGINTVINAIGLQVTTNISDISSNATDITTLFTGKIDLDPTAAVGTVDGDLYAAIGALGWENDVIE